MIQSIRLLPNPSLGGHWRGNSFQFGLPVKINLPEEIARNVLLDTEKEPSEFVSPVGGIAWLGGFSVQVLRGHSIDG